MKPAPRSGSTTSTRATVKDVSPSSSGCPTRRSSATSSAASTQAVPGDGMSRVAVSAVWASGAVRSTPRSGYPGPTAFSATSRAAPPCSSGARPMVGKSSVWLVCRPRARACASKSGAGGLSLRTTASPPISARASRARPPCNRSAKKPTAVSAATASVTASTSSRNSPARQSRRSEVQPKDQKEGTRCSIPPPYRRPENRGRDRARPSRRITPTQPARGVPNQKHRGSGSAGPLVLPPLSGG